MSKRDWPSATFSYQLTKPNVEESQKPSSNSTRNTPSSSVEEVPLLLNLLPMSPRPSLLVLLMLRDSLRHSRFVFWWFLIFSRAGLDAYLLCCRTTLDSLPESELFTVPTSSMLFLMPKLSRQQRLASSTPLDLPLLLESD